MKPEYHSEGEKFVIEGYQAAAPFSSFFPGIAGETGKPMWLFYVNRGQAVASFGVNNKDGAMLEFQPANKAYQSVSGLGFRTFLCPTGKSRQWKEPFQIQTSSPLQKMVIRPYEIELFDRIEDLGIDVKVQYFGVPNESVPTIARALTLTNTTGKSLRLDVIDGLPRVVPFGMNDYLAKHMSRTIEAFAEVLNLKAHVPVFKLKIDPKDRPEFEALSAGFFSFGIYRRELLTAVVDPSAVFGEDTSFSAPSKNFDIAAIGPQLCMNIMPSSLFAGRVVIQPHQSITWTEYYGHAGTQEIAQQFAERVRLQENYFIDKQEEMARITSELTGRFGLRTANETLNAYANLGFMDNVLRGGYPHSFSPTGPIIHLYSRKHGDMERDYNHFQISGTYYSQGNGSFRDVNQNRRHDLFLNPQVGDSNLEFFFNLLQLDGYNPLVINPVRFLVPRDLLTRPGFNMTEECRLDFQRLRREPALAGQIYEFIIKYSEDPLNNTNLFRDVMRTSQPQQSVQFGEGYWVDHWIYNLDHLDQYLSVYPEKKMWLMFEKADFMAYDSDHFVRPRREKYVISPEGHLRQFGAVVAKPEKAQLVQSRSKDPQWVRTMNGQGEVFRTTLFIKLLGLVAVKTSTLDPFGVGLEMEADRPGWCDALNGLPGLIGSSTHEMFELHRLVRFLLNEIIPIAPNKTVDLPIEISGLIRDVEDALAAASGSHFGPTWDKLATARESYRERVFMGVTGKERTLRIPEIRRFLLAVDNVLTIAGRKAMDPQTGLPTSYFTYEANVEHLKEGWRLHLDKLEWKQHRLVPFLEGCVHAMKLMPANKARQLARAVKRSDLYDKKLGMYKLNVSLEDESPEIGRIRVFSRGWLENESIFLHMHYKYLLELLRAGHMDMFLEAGKTGLIPFRNPRSYGRPTFENSSFVASTSFPCKDMHGKGFVARLSGATSEFMSMIYHLTFGPKPFKELEGLIVFSPDPRLPKEWFRKDHIDGGATSYSVSIKLFGTPVMYVSNQPAATFGSRAARPVEYEWILDGRFHHHRGPNLPPEPSQALREGRLETLTIILSTSTKV